MITKIAIGTVQFGLDYGISNIQGKTSVNEVAKILSVAKRNGIDTLDTAYAYGDSEKVLGKNEIEGFKIISKYPANTPYSFSETLQRSFDHLKQNQLYGYLAHNASILLENPRLWDNFEKAKQSAKVEKIGYSLYHPTELEQLLRLNMLPDLIQVPYNILDRRFEPYFAELYDRGVEIHTRSTFLQGLLLMNPEQLSSFFDPVLPILNSISKSALSISDKAGYLLQVCLKDQFISKVVIGLNDAEQLSENIQNVKADYAHYNIPSVENIPEEILNPAQWPKK